MCLEPWTPLEFVDDDLLTLEAAALLSLAAKHRIDEVNAAAEAWRVRQHGLSKYVDVANQVSKATGVLKELLQVTGLRLPSAVNRSGLASFFDALREMSSVVGASRDDSCDVRAAVGLLNLACEESTQQSPAVSDLFRGGMLEKAWQRVEDFVASSASKREIQQPEFRKPAPGEWNAHDTTLLGDSTPWTWGIGPMFQTLGGWNSAWLMARGGSEDEHWDRIRYWTPLPHLALGPLGWSDPAMGVARWILMGMPPTTPELSLLARVWGADALMYFSHPQMDWIPQSPELLGFHLRTSGSQIGHIFQASESAKAFWGCGELHMQVHLRWQLYGQQVPREVLPPTYINTRERHKFTLQLHVMTGWYTQLLTAGDELADKHPNWDLEVTVSAPPVGTLGTFRRSRLTGLWYSGSHEAHVLGHSNLSGPIRRIPSTGGPVATRPVRGELSLRHTNAVAFWIASELARRHPHYVLLGDSASGLRLVSGSGPTIQIWRRATVQVGETAISAAEILAADDKRKLIEDLEVKLGLPARQHAAATTERTVVYRAMAYVMAVTVSDKATWDFVPADPLTDGAWHLTRDARPVALLTPDGLIRFPQGPVNLLERYQAHSRKMAPLIGEVFRAVLP